MPAAWQSEPKKWRVRGKAADGLMVTLGRYNTEEEARADCQKFADEATYRDVTVQPIPPAPTPAPEPPR